MKELIRSGNIFNTRKVEIKIPRSKMPDFCFNPCGEIPLGISGQCMLRGPRRRVRRLIVTYSVATNLKVA